ncbi:GGDEF domain-containing protein [Vibrio rarus]|uniref:GGDEF domain-containing protein n=1 Tax=Vibrio rarus TaxID=413403 RepID=UPI0021C49FC2|nr:GGDEF domain-containing protein [Vibrio rarus]
MSHSFTLAPVSIIIITALAKVTILRKREIIVIYGCSILCGYLFVMYTHKHTEILSHHLLISNLMIISWLLYLGQDHYTTQLRNFTHNQQQRKAKQKITMQMMQLEAQKVQLQVLLGRDAMTGLYNRGYFDHQLLEEINRASRAHSPLGLLVIDVDHFKVVNDKLGHHIGDEYLKTLATTLDQTCRRETDTVARFGGEEFVILLPNTSHSGLISISQSLLQAVSDLNLPHPIQPKVSISIGGCEFDPDTMNRLTFFEKADQALYKVKTSGRDGFSIPPL